MPFPKQTPRAFNKTKVAGLNTGQIGCYGLYRANTCIYVGRGDIRARLIAHLNGDNSCIKRESPTDFVSVVTSEDEAKEKRLIAELQPVCNQKVG